MKLSKKQRLSRMIVLVILIVITGLSLSLIIGHYFSLAPLKEVARKESLELDQADPAYEATWAKALDQQRNLKGRYIGIGIIISLLTSTILMFFGTVCIGENGLWAIFIVVLQLFCPCLWQFPSLALRTI